LEFYNNKHLLNRKWESNVGFLIDFVYYLQNLLIDDLKIKQNDSEESNIIDCEIMLIRILIDCCLLMTQKLIVIIYSVFSFFSIINR
jgi:hypothetical protein